MFWSWYVVIIIFNSNLDDNCHQILADAPRMVIWKRANEGQGAFEEDLNVPIAHITRAAAEAKKLQSVQLEYKVPSDKPGVFIKKDWKVLFHSEGQVTFSR